jgi:hypothetical protein
VHPGFKQFLAICKRAAHIYAGDGPEQWDLIDVREEASLARSWPVRTFLTTGFTFRSRAETAGWQRGGYFIYQGGNHREKVERELDEEVA